MIKEKATPSWQNKGGFQREEEEEKWRKKDQKDFLEGEKMLLYYRQNNPFSSQPTTHS